jgi:hypothetical protein
VALGAELLLRQQLQLERLKSEDRGTLLLSFLQLLAEDCGEGVRVRHGSGVELLERERERQKAENKEKLTCRAENPNKKNDDSQRKLMLSAGKTVGHSSEKLGVHHKTCGVLVRV